MPSQIKMILNYEEQQKVTWNVGSAFQGIIMERIPFYYGEELHLSELKPYSQFVLNKNGEIVWTVNTLEQQADYYIADMLLSDTFSNFYLKNKNIEFTIVKKDFQKISYDMLIDTYFFENQNRIIEFQFISPTAFKSNGEYVFYPTIKAIFQSLINKFNFFCPCAKLYTPEILDEIMQYTKVIYYNLNSTKFYLEKIGIPAFIGNFKIKVTGPQQMVNLVYLLAYFGRFSGVGIKSALGMGGIEIIERRDKKE